LPSLLGLPAPPALPAPDLPAPSARIDTPPSPPMDSLHHRKSAPGRRATTRAPWGPGPPRARRLSDARIPVWLLPHRDPAAPPTQFRTTPGPGPDTSSGPFEMRPPRRADFSPRCGVLPRSVPRSPRRHSVQWLVRPFSGVPLLRSPPHLPAEPSGPARILPLRAVWLPYPHRWLSPHSG